MEAQVPVPTAWQSSGSVKLPRGGSVNLPHGGSVNLPHGGSMQLPRGGSLQLSNPSAKPESLRNEPGGDRSLLLAPAVGFSSITQPQASGYGGQGMLAGEGKFSAVGAGGAWRPAGAEMKGAMAATLGTQAATVAANRADTSIDVLAALVEAGPERARLRHRPPFQWLASPDYESEFEVTGRNKEIVTKVGDFRDPSWVIPVGSTLQLMKGASYRWTLRIEKLCPHQPQMQLGIHGSGHRRPWRLFTTSRCSRARDDEPWRERPEGDHSIEEGDFVHFEVDLRGLHLPFGTMSISVNTGPSEVVFDDIPLSVSTPVMPVVSMGGDQSRVRLCPAY